MLVHKKGKNLRGKKGLDKGAYYLYMTTLVLTKIMGFSSHLLFLDKLSHLDSWLWRRHIISHFATWYIIIASFEPQKINGFHFAELHIRSDAVYLDTKKSSYCHISSLLLAQWSPWDFLKFSTFDKIETFCVAEAINFAKRFVADHAWNKEVLFLKIPHLSCFSMLSNSFVFIRRKKLTMKNFNFNHFLNKSF